MPKTPEQQALLREVRIDQQLDAQVPTDTKFRDETGKTVTLNDYLGSKPVMLVLIQYRCTMLCSEDMKVLEDSLKQMRFTVGDQFNLVVVSIDAREQPALAAEYRRGYLADYNRPAAEKGWHFLVGEEPSIRKVADAIGYHFAYDARTDQFAHPDSVVILTPRGRVARYFFLPNYPPRDLRLGLIEASEEKIGTPLDSIALLCYHYDPITGRYGLAFMKVVRLAAGSTVLLLTLMVAGLSYRERRGKRRAEPTVAKSEE